MVYYCLFCLWADFAVHASKWCPTPWGVFSIDNCCSLSSLLQSKDPVDNSATCDWRVSLPWLPLTLKLLVFTFRTTTWVKTPSNKILALKKYSLWFYRVSQSPESFAYKTQFHSLHFSVHFCLTWIHGVPAWGNLSSLKLSVNFLPFIIDGTRFICMCLFYVLTFTYIALKSQLLFVTRTAIKWFYVICQHNLDFWIDHIQVPR